MSPDANPVLLIAKSCRDEFKTTAQIAEELDCPIRKVIQTISNIGNSRHYELIRQKTEDGKRMMYRVKKLDVKKTKYKPKAMVYSKNARQFNPYQQAQA